MITCGFRKPSAPAKAAEHANVTSSETVSVSVPWQSCGFCLQHTANYRMLSGKGTTKENPPTDWRSTFGGPAWSPSGQNDGQWYFHWFDSSQPDLNWDNEDVRDDFRQTLRFWGDRGVSGFRIDVAHGCAKDLTEPLPAWSELSALTARKLSNGNASLSHPLLDRDEVQDIYRDWRRIFNDYDPPLM